MRPLRLLSESEASLESFHDCHVHGLRWRGDRFTFSLSLQYILQWITPTDGAPSYRFSISEGELMFRNVDELKVSLDWSGAALDAQIMSVQLLKTRTTPSGAAQRYFEIEFADPIGTISLWATGYELSLLSEPVISEVTSIPHNEP
jgi:hypothetical protein